MYHSTIYVLIGCYLLDSPKAAGVRTLFALAPGAENQRGSEKGKSETNLGS